MTHTSIQKIDTVRNYSMSFDDLNITYRRSPRRKSIGLQVTAAGQVVVTLPRGTTQESLAQALTKHRAWIEARVAERKAAWEKLKEGEAYFLGRPYRLTALRGAKGAVSLNGDEIRVPITAGADLWPPLQAWYREQALRLLQERVRHWGGHMGLAPGPVALKEWKRRWGECHPDGTLKIQLATYPVPARGHRLRSRPRTGPPHGPGAQPPLLGPGGKGLAGLRRPPPLAEPRRRAISPVAAIDSAGETLAIAHFIA